MGRGQRLGWGVPVSSNPGDLGSPRAWSTRAASQQVSPPAPNVQRRKSPKKKKSQSPAGPNGAGLSAGPPAGGGHGGGSGGGEAARSRRGPSAGAASKHPDTRALRHRVVQVLGTQDAFSWQTGAGIQFVQPAEISELHGAEQRHSPRPALGRTISKCVQT